MSQEIVRWEIWWTNFDPQVGREQAGLRPAIVVGITFACQLPNQLVFVVPCTTTDRQLPFHPLVKSLGRPSLAMCDQVKSISRKRLTRRHPARLDPKETSGRAGTGKDHPDLVFLNTGAHEGMVGSADQ